MIKQDEVIQLSNGQYFQVGKLQYFTANYAIKKGHNKEDAQDFANFCIMRTWERLQTPKDKNHICDVFYAYSEWLYSISVHPRTKKFHAYKGYEVDYKLYHTNYLSNNQYTGNEDNTHLFEAEDLAITLLKEALNINSQMFDRKKKSQFKEKLLKDLKSINETFRSKELIFNHDKEPYYVFNHKYKKVKKELENHVKLKQVLRNLYLIIGGICREKDLNNTYKLKEFLHTIYVKEVNNKHFLK